jgi:hypothetical protein
MGRRPGRRPRIPIRVHKQQRPSNRPPSEEEDMYPSNKPTLEATSTGPEVRGAVAAPEATAAVGSSEAAADIGSLTNCIY